MSAFLYYLPGVTGRLKKADIEAAGLAYAFDDEMPLPVETGGIPGGSSGGGAVSGVILADQNRVKKPGYHPDQQEWQPIPGTNAMVGWDKQNPPQPADIQRDRILSGYWVELADGRDWAVPVIRNWKVNGRGIVGLPALPKHMDCDDEGRFVPGRVLGRYEELWRVVDEKYVRIHKLMEAEDEEALKKAQAEADAEIDDLNDVALRILAVNYRIGVREAVVMGIFTEPNPYAVDIFNAAIDLRGWLQIKKKLGLATSSTPTG